MQYIENKKEYGIDYNLKPIIKRFKALEIPNDVYHPPITALEKAKYIFNLSDRSRGKTTNWLLLGMCFNAEYGTIIQYIRQTEDMTRETTLKHLFEVINTFDNGRYVLTLTDDQYNNVGYDRSTKSFYYRCIDDEGKELCRKESHFCKVLSIDKNYDLKSTYNAPTGDFIIFDEFISKMYRINECIDFFDLLSTIIRQRKSPVVIMLSNTINRNSMYFEEFQISKEIKAMKSGDKKYITTDLGTTIYIEILEGNKTVKKKEHNKLFFGFNNPKLASITGSEEWAHEVVKHIPPFNPDTMTTINKRLYMEISPFEYLNIEVVIYDGHKSLFVHRATRTHDDSIILSNRTQNTNVLYGLGTKKINDIIMKCLANRRVYYASNEVGSDFKNYIRIAKQNKYDL